MGWPVLVKGLLKSLLNQVQEMAQPDIIGVVSNFTQCKVHEVPMCQA